MEAVENGISIAGFTEEILFGKEETLRERALRKKNAPTRKGLGSLPVLVHTDSKGAVEAIAGDATSQLAPARRRGIAQVRECLDLGEITCVNHILGPTNPVYPLTKPAAQAKGAVRELQKLLKTGIYKPHYGA